MVCLHKSAPLQPAAVCLPPRQGGCFASGLYPIWLVLLVALLEIKISMSLVLNHLNTQTFPGVVHREGQH